MSLLLLIAVPVVIGLVAFFKGKRRITPRELAIQVGVVVALMFAGWYLARWTSLRDTEIWNGRVADKKTGRHECCHSYKCRCREICSGSGSEKRCKEECDTCYEHSHDVYFKATSTNDETIFYDGCNPPGYWSSAYDDIFVGEPTAWEHSYTNYIKADPAAFFREPASQFDNSLPEYPEVDGYKAQRFLYLKSGAFENARWNYALSELNADLGAPRQVNIIVIVTGETDPEWYEALRWNWLGGKKNDVVLAVSVDDAERIRWARVMAWNEIGDTEDTFTGLVEEGISGLGTFDPGKLLEKLRDSIESSYRRRSFSEFEYLLAKATPTPWALAILILVGSLASGIFTYNFWKNGEEMMGVTADEVAAGLWARFRGLFWREARGASGVSVAARESSSGVSSDMAMLSHGMTAPMTAVPMPLASVTPESSLSEPGASTNSQSLASESSPSSPTPEATLVSAPPEAVSAAATPERELIPVPPEVVSEPVPPEVVSVSMTPDSVSEPVPPEVVSVPPVTPQPAALTTATPTSTPEPVAALSPMASTAQHTKSGPR